MGNKPGRPFGSKNSAESGRRGSAQFKIIRASKRAKKDGLDGLDRMWAAQMAKASGTILAITEEGVIYAVPPDPAAARVISDRLYGRPKETVEIIDENEKFKGLPQLLIVVPKGYTGEPE